MEPRTVGVLGTGTMGAGIVQVAAQSGFKVVACDHSVEEACQHFSKLPCGQLVSQAERSSLLCGARQSFWREAVS